MMGTARSLLAVVALVLAAVTGYEIYLWPRNDNGVPREATPSAAAQMPIVAREAAASRADEWAAAILARPLFDSARQAEQSVLAGPAASLGLPRLSGIVSGPSAKIAIFMTNATGKPIVVTEGGQIGPFTVRSIGVDAVSVLGPDGLHTVHPTFEQSAGPGRSEAEERRPTDPGRSRDLRKASP